MMGWKRVGGGSGRGLGRRGEKQGGGVEGVVGEVERGREEGVRGWVMEGGRS